jgi:hypothetical protein
MPEAYQSCTTKVDCGLKGCQGACEGGISRPPTQIAGETVPEKDQRDTALAVALVALNPNTLTVAGIDQ